MLDAAQIALGYEVGVVDDLNHWADTAAPRQTLIRAPRPIRKELPGPQITKKYLQVEDWNSWNGITVANYPTFLAISTTNFEFEKEKLYEPVS